jgi:zinc D-Ala-D-Ala carboxypeptidase
MKLSPNFTLEELTVSDYADRHGLDNTPGNDHLYNLQRLAAFLETLRAVLGKPISINSAYRSPEVNAAIKGSKTSQHCHGTAADIKVSGMVPDQVVKRIIASTLPYDQVIREFSDPVRGGGWTHVSIPNVKDVKPRKMALIIDKLGTRAYKSGG